MSSLPLLPTSAYSEYNQGPFFITTSLSDFWNNRVPLFNYDGAAFVDVLAALDIATDILIFMPSYSNGQKTPNGNETKDPARGHFFGLASCKSTSSMWGLVSYGVR